MDNPVIITFVVGLITALLGSGGMYAWFKLGPERKKIYIEVAEHAADLQGDVLDDLKEAYNRVCEELVQIRMQMVSREREHGECQKRIHEMEMTITSLRQDLDRHGRMAEMARRKSHLALNAIGNYELHIDNLLTILREHDVPITPMMHTHRLRKALQAEMNKLEEIESTTVERAIKQEDEAS